MNPGEKNSPTHHKIFLADHQGNHLTFFSSAEFLTLQNFSDWEVCRDKNFSNWLSFKISSSEWGKLSSHNNSWILTLEKWPPSANKSTYLIFPNKLYRVGSWSFLISVFWKSSSKWGMLSSHNRNSTCLKFPNKCLSDIYEKVLIVNCPSFLFPLGGIT